jgi:hypothetical protein
MQLPHTVYGKSKAPFNKITKYSRCRFNLTYRSAGFFKSSVQAVYEFMKLREIERESERERQEGNV